jgi:hypothetical protein
MTRPVTPPPNKDTPTLFTKGDIELQSILDLHEASRRLENVIKEVQLFIDTVNDDRISRKTKGLSQKFSKDTSFLQWRRLTLLFSNHLETYLRLHV